MNSARHSGGHPFIIIPITILFLITTSSSELSSTSHPDTTTEFEPANADTDELPNNVPVEPCDFLGNQANVTTIFLDPPCEPASQGYCGMRRNQNYTLITKWTPKGMAKAMTVKVTSKDPLYGWETLIWPEFSVCNRFNISCPQTSTDAVTTYVKDTLPKEVPPMRALVRVRLLGVWGDNIKRVVICRQFKAQVF